VQRDPAIAVGKLMAGHLADLNAMEIDRRLIADLQQPVGDQVIRLAIDKAFPGRGVSSPAKERASVAPFPGSMPK
jgi:hypothetical protein